VREDAVDAFEREADADAVLVAVNLGKEPRRFTSPYLHVVDSTDGGRSAALSFV
jgi:hypothetical protein